METMPVAAVRDTRTVFDENGDASAVPCPGFRSDGLDRVMEWLFAYAREERREEAPPRRWHWFRQRLKGW
ncbi:MAG: hypothetical protein LIQ31_13755 [Planctomycetes bacterium]|nr:hypothetical protein [Planctomycetota bacterium]